MTKDEALKLALEALESTGENNGYHGVTQYFDEKMVDQAITAIKAALEAKDGCQCPACKVAPHASDCAVHSEPAYPAGECNCGASGEPVAWQDTAKPSELVAAEDWDNIDPQWHWMYRPLYATPSQRKPLTEQQIKEALADMSALQMPLNKLIPAIARAIEAAHGIKEAS